MATHHSDGEINIENANNITPIVYSTLIVALLFAVAYVMTHISQELIFLVSNGLSGYATSEGFVYPDSHFISNISNLGYLFQGVIMVCLPLNFLIGQKNSYIKIVLLKVLLLLMAFTYIMGEAWILKWLYEAIFKGNVTWNMLQFQKDNAYMFNHMSWGSNNPICIVLDVLAAGCWCLLARDMNNNFKRMHKNIILTMIVTFGLPMIFFAIRLLLGVVMPGTFKSGVELLKELGLSYQNGEYTPWWYTKSAFFMAYLVVMAFYFWYTSQNESRYEEYTCEIGDLKTIVGRSKKNYTSSKLSNLFGNDARKYYKDEMKKESKSKHSKSKHSHSSKEDGSSSDGEHHHHSSDPKDFKPFSPDMLEENKKQIPPEEQPTGDGDVENTNPVVDDAVGSEQSTSHHHHHHHHHSSSSSDGHSSSSHHHHHHSEEPRNWQPVTQNVKSGIKNDERGAKSITDILQEQGVVATTVNTLSNDASGHLHAEDVLNHPGIAMNTGKSAAAGMENASIEDMVRLQQQQQAEAAMQAASAQSQIQLLQAQLQALQQQQQLQQIQQLQQQIADLQNGQNK